MRRWRSSETPKSNRIQHFTVNLSELTMGLLIILQFYQNIYGIEYNDSVLVHKTYRCTSVEVLQNDKGMRAEVQGVHEKLSFFTIHCNLANIAVIDLQSSQRNASVHSLLLAGNFLYNQQQPSAGEEEVANFREFQERNTIYNEHPV